MKRDYFHSLDGIRGLLALTVAYFHVQWPGFLTTNAFIQNGYLAVDFFFCLSGFLMFRLYGDMQSRADVKSFMFKRFARIYPLHLFTLCAFAAYLGLRATLHLLGYPILDAGEAIPLTSQSTDNPMTFLSNMFLIQALGIHDSLTFNGPAWSISTEFFTYIIFAIVTFFSPLKTRKHIVYLMLFSLTIYVFLSLSRPNLDISHDLGLLRCIAGFSVGMVSSWLFDRARPLLEHRTALISNILEVVVLSTAIFWVTNVQGLMTFTIAPVLLSLMIVFAAGQGWLSNILGRGVFRYLGKISYSLYLNHALIIIGFNLVLNRALGGVTTISPLMGTLVSLAYLVVLIITSHATYHLVERPAVKWFSREQRNNPLRERIARITHQNPQGFLNS